MCSMGFSPRNTGEIPPFIFSPPDIDGPLSFLDESTTTIKKMARLFWDRLGESDHISEEFKFFLEKGNPLDQLREQPTPSDPHHLR